MYAFKCPGCLFVAIHFCFSSEEYCLDVPLFIYPVTEWDEDSPKEGHLVASKFWQLWATCCKQLCARFLYGF